MAEQARREAQRSHMVRDLIMGAIMLLWMVFAITSVIQLFSSGSKVLDSLLPFWFWGIPIGPYTALYRPWKKDESEEDSAEPPAKPIPPAAEEPPEAVA